MWQDWGDCVSWITTPTGEGAFGFDNILAISLVKQL
jgi:hypothetical protein